MGWFTLKRSRDPISERTRALNSEIAALEEQIKKLHTQAAVQPQPQPRLRSTALPHGQTQTLHAPMPPRTHEPIFEDLHKSPLKNHNETPATPAHNNELGVRKYVLVAAWRRFANQF